MTNIIPLTHRLLLPFAMTVNPHYREAEHLHKIASKLQSVERGKIKRLIILGPPRHGKSMLVSQYFPPWFMAKNPRSNVMEICYGQDLATDFGRKVRNLTITPEFRLVFPHFQLREDSTAAHRFESNQGNEYFAVGANGSLTGRGAKLILVDDIVKNPEEAASKTIQRRTMSLFRGAITTRLTSDGRVVLSMTRWNQGDLVGQILADPEIGQGWEVLELKAINDKGEALWPDMFPIERLLQAKREVGSREFESQYQQNPSSPEGVLIKREWMTKFWKQLPARFDRVIQSWDLSFEGTEDSDFVVGQTWGILKADRYLIDQVRGQMNFPSSIAAMKSFRAKHKNVSKILVEKKANGHAAIQTIKSDLSGVVPFVPHGTKEDRVKAVSPQFEAGNIWLPDPSLAPWIHDYIEEFVGFPNMGNDDQVDATTQVLIDQMDGGGYSLNKMIL